MNLIRVFVATLAGLLLSGFPQSAFAQCQGSVCTDPPRQRFVHHDAIVVEPVLAATFVPVAVAVPQYSVGPYATGYAPSATPSPELDALKAEITKLQKQIEALKAKPPIEGPPKTQRTEEAPKTIPPAEGEQVPPLAAVTKLFSAKCAACHGAATANAKGGGHVFIDKDGKLVALNDKQVRKITSDIYSKRMPKKGDPLADQEVGVWMDYLASLR